MDHHSGTRWQISLHLWAKLSAGSSCRRLFRLGLSSSGLHYLSETKCIHFTTSWFYWLKKYVDTRVSQPNMFFKKKIFPTHSRGIWGLFGRTPKEFLIWTSFKGCTWPSKIWPTSSKKTKVAAVAEWQWREVSLTFNIDIVSFRPHHLFAWWWGALPPGYLDLCTKCYQVTSRQGNSLGRGPLTPWPTLVSQTTLVFTCHCSSPPNGFDAHHTGMSIGKAPRPY